MLSYVLWSDDRLARRAKTVAPRLRGPHVPSEFGEETIFFDSGFAAPQRLPDLSKIAQAALTDHREEVLQYASGRGQPHLRAWLADWRNQDGCTITPDHILVTKIGERRGGKEGVRKCRSRWSTDY